MAGALGAGRAAGHGRGGSALEPLGHRHPRCGRAGAARPDLLLLQGPQPYGGKRGAAGEASVLKHGPGRSCSHSTLGSRLFEFFSQSSEGGRAVLPELTLQYSRPPCALLPRSRVRFRVCELTPQHMPTS